MEPKSLQNRQTNQSKNESDFERVFASKMEPKWSQNGMENLRKSSLGALGASKGGDCGHQSGPGPLWEPKWSQNGAKCHQNDTKMAPKWYKKDEITSKWLRKWSRTNQPTNKLTNQQTNKPTNQQPANTPVNQPTKQPNKQMQKQNKQTHTQTQT